MLLLPLIILSGGTITFDNSTQCYFLADNPALIAYESLYENFGDNEYLLVGIEAGASKQGIFTTETLAALAAISDFLDFHPNVNQMLSLYNYQFISGNPDALNTETTSTAWLRNRLKLRGSRKFSRGKSWHLAP